MKLLIATSMLIMSLSSFAATPTPPASKPARKVAQEQINCSNTPDEIVSQIGNAPSCRDGIRVAEQCGYGSSIDYQFVDAAKTLCYAKDLKKISKADKKLVATLEKRCATLCNSQTEGTMCNSFMSYCELNATKFFISFYDKLN
jgi:hypothetical protein